MPLAAELPVWMAPEPPPPPEPVVEMAPPEPMAPLPPAIDLSPPVSEEPSPQPKEDFAAPALAELPPPPAELPLPAMWEPPPQLAEEQPPAPTPTLTPVPEMLALPPPDAESEAPAADAAWHQDQHEPDDIRPEPPSDFGGAAPPVELEPDIEEAITLRRSLSAEFFSWLSSHLPARPSHLPADAIEPSWTERRTAAGLAAVLAATALLGLLPVVVLGHANLLAAPRWRSRWRC